MQYFRNPFPAKTARELAVMSPDDLKSYTQCNHYYNKTKDNLWFNWASYAECVKRGDVILSYSSLHAPYVFVAYSGADVVTASLKFTDADSCEFFYENLKFQYNDDELLELTEYIQTGYTIDVNEFSPDAMAVTLSPVKIDTVIPEYVGSLKFPCIVSVWLSCEGYSRKIDGTTVINLNDLGVNSFRELDK